jgi:hypothetical protein
VTALKSLLIPAAVPNYQELLADKNREIDVYRHRVDYAEDLSGLRDSIREKREAAYNALDDIFHAQFEALGIKYEQATWDAAKGKEGKPVKRKLTVKDIEDLRPFHWGYEFDEILNTRGGFDAIITNPPWEIFKPNGKEFFEDHSELVSKKNMTVHDFEKAQAKLLKDADIRAAWEDYLSQFPHQSEWYRKAPEYAKLFVERCYLLLRPGGDCGIVIPSGIYTDLGTKQLRELLFNHSNVTGLFCFENRKEIFEGVHCSFKFVVFTFEKQGSTAHFPAAFMRLDVQELEDFPRRGALDIQVALVRTLSPDSLSVMEFKTPLDVQIAEKMLKFPLLGEEIEGKWNVKFNREFDMTNDSELFKDSPGNGRLPLYEGKMIWHFEHEWEKPRYWVNEKEARKAVLGKEKDTGQQLDYQHYRFGFRDIASNTNERTAVTTIIPRTFHGNKVPTARILDDNRRRLIQDAEQLFLSAIANSFIFDFMIRMRVTTTLNFFYLYQMPVPRLMAKDTAFAPLMSRAAKLICTTPEYDDLAKEVGLTSHKNGVTNPTERAKLRAEIDGLVAHLYGLTEAEFAHVLSTFPIVPDPVKVAAQNAYRDVERGLVK